MTVEVRIPTQLRPLVGGGDRTEASGSSVRQIFDDLTRRYPDLATRLLDDEGQIRRFVNVYVNDEDVRFLQGLDTSIRPGGCISIIPAIAGGQDPAEFLRAVSCQINRGAPYRKDLVERLRRLEIQPGSRVSRPAIVNEAAHELERLQEAIDVLFVEFERGGRF
jgi:sulfur-carrier protein